MNIFPFPHFPHRLCRQSICLLHYGLFSILCQLSLILLHTKIHAESVSGAMLSLRFWPMLEHAMLSLVILLLGVYLIERANGA